MSDVSAVVHLLAKVNEGFVTTAGGSITSGAATVPLTSVSGLTNGTTFVGIIEPGATNQQTFTGVVDTGGSQITGVKWTRGTNTAHAGGTTIVDYSTGTVFNMLTRWAAVQHNDDGTHSTITATSVAATTMTVGGVDVSQLTPTGVTTAFAGSLAPTGWLLCDGSSVLRATYPALYAVIGATYGAVDGTHFTLPDLRGRVVVAPDSSAGRITSSNTLSASSGSATHTLSASEMPVHSHTLNDAGHTHAANALVHAGGGGVDWTNNGGTQKGSANLNWSDGTTTGSNTTGITMNNAGSGGAHNNLQPYLVLNYIIKT